MGDGSQGFSLTPDEERFFVRFFRRRALPFDAVVGAVAGGIAAAVLGGIFVPAAVAPVSEPIEVFDSPGLSEPFVDEQARAELAALRRAVAELRAQPTASPEPAEPAEPDHGRLAELRRSVDGLKRELQTLATSVTELRSRPFPDSVPAAPDAAASPDLEPLRTRMFNVEARQDREETSRLEWAGIVEQRVRNLELARHSRESEEQAALQGILDRLHNLEQTLHTR